MQIELSFTEENYLKALFHLSFEGRESVNTNALAESMHTSPASVNDMIKRLFGKKLLSYQKYKGAKLLPKGQEIALHIIRKHRLWEFFLVDKLNFEWDQVHEVAEQLEHIESPLLIKRLDDFLGNPTIDPHGDPIPDENGRMKEIVKAPASQLAVETLGILVAVNNDDAALLQHLDRIGIQLGVKLRIVDRMAFDESVCISIHGAEPQYISKTIAENLMVSVIK